MCGAYPYLYLSEVRHQLGLQLLEYRCPINLGPIHFIPPWAREVCVSICCTIVLIGARCQLDEVSVCCEASVGQMHCRDVSGI